MQVVTGPHRNSLQEYSIYFRNRATFYVLQFSRFCRECAMKFRINCSTSSRVYMLCWHVRLFLCTCGLCCKLICVLTQVFGFLDRSPHVLSTRLNIACTQILGLNTHPTFKAQSSSIRCAQSAAALRSKWVGTARFRDVCRWALAFSTTYALQTRNLAMLECLKASLSTRTQRHKSLAGRISMRSSVP